MGAMDHFPFQVVNVWGSTENGKGIPKQFQICMYIYIYGTPPKKKNDVFEVATLLGQITLFSLSSSGGYHIYSTPRDSRSFFWILNLKS